MTAYTTTDKQQSKRLLDCGLTPQSADMAWTSFWSDGVTYTSLCPNDEFAVEPGNLDIVPAWSLSALLSLIPAIIYHPDSSDSPLDATEEELEKNSFIPQIKQWQWMMWRNPESRFTDNEGECIIPASFSMTYETIGILPPDHPIAPNSTRRVMLFDDDGDHLIWNDENPIEVCVQAIEWLTSHGQIIN